MENKHKSEKKDKSGNERKDSRERTITDECGCFAIVDACGCRVVDPCGCYSSCYCC